MNQSSQHMTTARSSQWKTFMLLLFLIKNIPTESAADCLTVKIIQEYYVQNHSCNSEGTLLMSIYEDCPINEIIFELDAGLTIRGCNGLLYQGDDGVGYGFLDVKDAEDTANNHQVCSPFLSDGTTDYNAVFYFTDVNEFSPVPANGLGTTESIEPDENTKGVIMQFSYTDPDLDETSTLIYSNLEGNTDDMFSIETNGIDESGTVMMYNLVASKMLDYETVTFYNLKVTFTSEDARKNASSTDQTFLVFVQDLGDNAPFFTLIVPFASCEEEYVGSVFQVEALDRDVNINNAISYSIISGNDDGYFDIDSSTGNVSTVKAIDRESLTSTLFPLVIQALEILESGTPAPDPNNSTEVTNVNILDINDNIPLFDNLSYDTAMDEFDGSNPVTSKNLDTVIFVTDMDEGRAGQYVLTTDNPDVVLNPTSGSGNTSFGVQVNYNSATGDFDYEQHAENPTIVIQITATEVDDNEHHSTATLNIKLIDLNDNSPIFNENEYVTGIREDVGIGTLVITVSATDADSSSEYNEDSIVYSLNGCDNLVIGNKSGQIDTAKLLDYESQEFIICSVIARDMDGISPDSKMSSTTLTVNIVDVNDELPVFQDFVNNADLNENTASGTNVSLIYVDDPDTTAALLVELIYPESATADMRSWFRIMQYDNTGGSYFGAVVVNSPPDREKADQVIVTIQASDINYVGNPQQVNETLTISIIDVNDNNPTFVNDYSSESFDENTPVDTKVGTIIATDPDLNDVVSYFMSDNEYLFVNETSGDIFVKQEIDREVMPYFQVVVMASDLASHKTSFTMNVTVNDLNDNDPVLDEDICSYDGYNVSEGDESGKFLVQVYATDADEGKHAEIIYVLQNPNNIGYYYQKAPFVIDSSTGIITVNNSVGFALDRETFPDWQLSIFAYDQCEINEPKCNSRNVNCFIAVTVTDINDNSPGNYKPVEDIQTNEFLREGEEISTEISAFDTDEENSPNSQITFTVVAMRKEGANETLDPLFVADNKNRTNTNGISEFYCNLVATTNLTGLRDTYVVQILAEDHGLDPQQMSSSHDFTVVVNDANDQSPIFDFSSCLIDNDQTITMYENITETNSILNCSCYVEVSNPAIIYVTDDDEPNSDNSRVNLFIYSTDPVASPENQADAFVIYTISPGQFGISIKEPLDREMWDFYNLTLVAKDEGTPQRITYSWIYIVVVDVSEFPPTFCELEPCTQTLYIEENTDEETPFLDATDQDINDLIFYSIINYDIAAFYIPQNQKATIRPIKSDTLDRERVANYTLDIWAANSVGGTPGTGVENTNQVLHVVVIVMDQNDNAPTYENLASNDIIYGDFLDTGHKGDQVALLDFEDADLNETLTYTIENIVWNDNQSYTDPFSIDVIDELRSNIKLNMDPVGKYGYCIFTVYATDKGGVHRSCAFAQVFVVTTEYMVSFLFLNDVKEVESQKTNIEIILSNVFNYTSVIDSIDTAVDSQNNPIENEAVVLAHFIGEVNTSAITRKLQSYMSIFSRNAKNNLCVVRTSAIGNGVVVGRYVNLYDNRNYGNELMEVQSEIIGNGRNDEIKTSDNMSYFSQLIKIMKTRNFVKNFSKEMEKRQIESSEVKEKNSLIKTNTDVNSYVDDTSNANVQYELIPKTEIETTATNGAVTVQLMEQFNLIGLTLVKIGDYQLPTNDPDHSTIVALKISLGSITLILGLIVVLLLIAFIVRTTKLTRQIKVLSTNTFGSKSSDIDKMGLADQVFPGSNKYANEGANPMFNLEATEIPKTDTTSVASWDSVLVGVEDNPEFQGFKNLPSSNVSKQAGESPLPSFNDVGFTKLGIDSALFPEETKKFNPLFDLASHRNGSEDESASSRQLDISNSTNLANSEDVQLNSQFSFL